MKNLIVNADDLGWTEGVNRGIAEAHRNGIVTSSSLLANGAAFASAVELARSTPGLGVGVHLNLSDGEPVAPRELVPTLLNEKDEFAGAGWTRAGRARGDLIGGSFLRHRANRRNDQGRRGATAPQLAGRHHRTDEPSGLCGPGPAGLGDPATSLTADGALDIDRRGDTESCRIARDSPDRLWIRIHRNMKSEASLKYSIVVPFFNEQENFPPLYMKLTEVMDALGESYELIFVDDGSRDNTFKVLSDIYEHDHRVNIVRLRRNFGQTAGLKAG